VPFLAGLKCWPGGSGYPSRLCVIRRRGAFLGVMSMNLDFNTILAGGVGGVTFFAAWLYLILTWLFTGDFLGGDGGWWF
jgi:hypothetical protein